MTCVRINRLFLFFPIILFWGSILPFSKGNLFSASQKKNIPPQGIIIIGLQRFENKSQNQNIKYFEEVIPDSLGTSLEYYNDVKIIRRIDIKKFFGNEINSIGKILSIEKNSDLDIIILGRYTLAGNSLKINCAVLSIKQRGVIYRLNFHSSIDNNFFSRMDQIAHFLVKKLQQNHYFKNLIALKYSGMVRQ